VQRNIELGEIIASSFNSIVELASHGFNKALFGSNSDFDYRRYITNNLNVFLGEKFGSKPNFKRENFDPSPIIFRLSGRYLTLKPTELKYFNIL
jgi:hypothetical protein